MPGCHVDGVTKRVTKSGPAEVVIATRATRSGARCPSCGSISYAIHSTYTRSPRDLPSLGREVRLKLHVRRFYCRNDCCRQHTFAERLPGLLGPHSRRTCRLSAAQGTVGIAMGGEAGARLLTQLSMPASADTILRLVRRIPLRRQGTPAALGVDDWALKKGRTYGTILVDLDQHHVVDLLPDRTAPTLATWLARHPGVERIARDRSTEYACGASAGAPGAIQIADRWHLLLNARQMTERWLASVHTRLRQIPPTAEVSSQGSSARRTQAYHRTEAEAVATAESRKRWMIVYEEVKRRRAEGEPLLVISRKMGIARATARKYAYAQSFPERAARVPAPSILDPYLAHLDRRVTAGCENASELWREICAMGFSGTPRQVFRWLRDRRTVPANTTARKYRKHSHEGRRPARTAIQRAPPIPSPKQLAWLVVQPESRLSVANQMAIARIKQDAEAAHVIKLVQQFVGTVRGSAISTSSSISDARVQTQARLSSFDAWLTSASTSGIRALETFAAGLAQDGDAVRAALTTPWSNAQAEGQITKLKLLKRQMYGRANFDLLRRRVLLSA